MSLPPFFTRTTSSPSGSVSIIIGNRASVKVMRVTARPIIAIVKHMKPAWVNSVKESIRNAVGCYSRTVELVFPIPALFEPAPQPRPALILGSDFNVAPEPFGIRRLFIPLGFGPHVSPFNTFGFWNHEMNITTLG